MDIDRDKLVNLTADDKSVVLKELVSLNAAMKQLRENINANNLTEEMRDCLVSILNSCALNCSEMLAYDSKNSVESKIRDNMFKTINEEVRSLRKQLLKNNKSDGITEFLIELESALYKWWKSNGFSVITDTSFGAYGFNGEFSLDISLISFMSTRPVTDSECKQSKLEKMVEEGYELVKESRTCYELLDTPKNRELIISLLKNKFPSVKIMRWNNVLASNESDKFILRGFEAYIKDLSEIEEILNETKCNK